MFKGVFYGRYSTDMQQETSIKGQRRAVEEFAEKFNIEIVEEYIDRGRSGQGDKREDFQRMIEDITEGNLKVNFVIVWKLDRFARNDSIHHEYECLLEKHGVSILSATENVNGNDLANKLVKEITVLFNQEEVRKLIENVNRGKKETALEGKWCGGTPPLGYDVDKETQKLVVNDTEAKIVKLAFKLRAQGFSYTYIINKLNGHNYKTKRGNEFGKNSLFDLFNNIKYKGIYEYNRASAKSKTGTYNRHSSKNEDEIIRIEGGCPQIVSTEIWDKVKSMSRKHSEIKPKGNYLLSGMVVCKCGAKMQVNNRGKYISFFCPEHKKNKCDGKEVNMEHLQKFVLFELAKKIFDKKSIDNFLNSYDEVTEKKRKKMKKHKNGIKRQIREEKQKISKCITAIESSSKEAVIEALTAKIEEHLKTKERLERQLKHLQTEVDEKPSIEDVKKLQNDFIAYMSSQINLPSRKNILEQLVEEIKVLDDKIEVVFNL